jgi:hypothetical protein
VGGEKATRFLGVRSTPGGRFHARGKIGKREVYLGSYETPEEASVVREAWVAYMRERRRVDLITAAEHLEDLKVADPEEEAGLLRVAQMLRGMVKRCT